MSVDPIALVVGSLSVRWLTVFWLLGGCVAAGWWYRSARAGGVDAATLVDALGWVVPAALVGARLFHLLSSPEHYLLQPADAWSTRGGLALWGAIAAGALAGLLVARSRHLPAFRLLDWAAPGLALGEAVGRIGCLIDGSNLGPPTTLPWAVLYAQPLAQPPDFVLPRHPTPAYHALAALASFVVLVIVRRQRGGMGTLFALWLVLHAASRFALGYVRVEPVLIVGLQVSQLWSLVALALLASGIIRHRRAASRASRPGDFSGDG